MLRCSMLNFCARPRRPPPVAPAPAGRAGPADRRVHFPTPDRPRRAIRCLFNAEHSPNFSSKIKDLTHLRLAETAQTRYSPTTMKNLSEKLLENQALIRAYQARRLTAREIGQKLGYSESYVMTTLSRIGVRHEINPNSTYQQQKKGKLLARVRKEYREFLAKQVLEGTLKLSEAATVADCSERTIVRFVQKLKEKPTK